MKETGNKPQLLSTLWLFAMLNYIYADILMLIVNPAVYQKAAASMSTSMVLGLSVLMEIPMAMVLLARVLPYRVNRWANIVAGLESTAFQGVTLVGNPPAYYVFFSAVEMLCTLFIAWYAFTWRPSTTPGTRP